MSDADKKKLRQYSKDVLIEHMAALGLINWRLLDVRERVHRAQQLRAKYELLSAELERLKDKKTVQALERSMWTYNRLKKVQRDMDKIMEKMNA